MFFFIIIKKISFIVKDVFLVTADFFGGEGQCIFCVLAFVCACARDISSVPVL